ncbi:MAG: hypothetical protein DRH50_08895, partial [Deltaproteobacteria bacterium]
MKTHKTMLKNQSVFSYPWVARMFWIRPCRFSNFFSLNNYKISFLTPLPEGNDRKLIYHGSGQG